MKTPKNRHGHVDSRWTQGATLDFTVSDLTLVDLDLDQGGTGRLWDLRRGWQV